MSDAEKKPDALTTRLREQLLLSQVRIMELEDARDSLAQRVADERGLVSAAQSLADGTLEKLAHLEKVHSVLEAEYRHMRHMQHVTNEALKESWALATIREQRLSALDAERKGMVTSRSWRWSAPIRTIERWLRR